MTLVIILGLFCDCLCLQIIDLAAFKDDQRFYFYNDLENFKDDPHMIRIAYEDDLGVSEEIYSRLTFNNSGIR